MTGRVVRRLPLLVLGAIAAASPVAAGAGEAGAGAAAVGATPAGFVATAAAQDARVTYSVLGFAAVEDVIDGGGTVAQAQLDGAGNGRSFAALPYPGDLVVSGPGLFAFATGQQLPGGYPFFVAAETPLRPEAKLDGPGGGYSLLAQAAPHRSAGKGRLLLGDGETGGRTNGEAITEVTGDGTVRSAATSVTEGLAFPVGRLRIGAVRSSSVTTLAPGADRPTSTSSLVVEGMTVGGTPVTVGPDGLSFPGPAREVLARAGIQVQLVEAQPHQGGERARSLEIRMIAAPPFPGFPPQQAVISFGGATTAINVGESLPGAVAPVPAAPVSEPPTASTAPQPDPSPEAPSEPPTGRAPSLGSATGRVEASAGPVGGRSFLVAAPEPGTDPPAPAAAAPALTTTPVPAPTALTQAQPVQRVTLARGLRHPITEFYLPLVVGAAVALAGAFLWLTRGGSSA